MTTGTPANRIGVTLLWLSGAFTLAAAVVAATGGGSLDVGSVRLSMHSVLRPLVAALGCGACAVIALRQRGVERVLDPVERALPLIAWPLAAGFAVVIGLSTYAGGAQVAGGADSSGYLSEARLWREAGLGGITQLQRETPLARDLRLANGQYPFTPIGFQPSGEGTIVPGYPPGLPLHFAAASALLGEQLQFVVVPLSAAGIIVVAFFIGRRLGGAESGLVAAVAAGASPILIYQAVQPMSDVVAAFWWSLGVLLLFRKTETTSGLAGVAFSIACVVRPNLFAMTPVALVLAWWWQGPGARRLARTGMACLPIGVAAFWFVHLQRTLYGGAATTGYGEVSTLFALGNVLPNASRYARWAVFSQSALLIAALASPLMIRFGWITPRMDREQAERAAWSALIGFACLQLFYLLYLVFDDWVYFRFLLPALPLVLAMQAVVFVALTCRIVPSPYRGIALILVATLVASWGVGRARAVGAFRLQESERRYVQVAGFTRTLPPNSVFVTLQHSGSLWYYNRAAVLRWDWIDAGEVDGALAALARAARPAYLVLDTFEEPGFRERFAATPFAASMKAPLFSAGIPGEIVSRVYAVSASPTAAVAPPVSWQSPPAPRTRRTPGAPARESAPVNALR